MVHSLVFFCSQPFLILHACVSSELVSALVACVRRALHARVMVVLACVSPYLARRLASVSSMHHMCVVTTSKSSSSLWRAVLLLVLLLSFCACFFRLFFAPVPHSLRVARVAVLRILFPLLLFSRSFFPLGSCHDAFCFCLLSASASAASSVLPCSGHLARTLVFLLLIALSPSQVHGHTSAASLAMIPVCDHRLSATLLPPVCSSS